MHIYIFYWLCAGILWNIGAVQGAIKKWVPNTNFENPENWNAGRVPCSKDVVKFPANIGTVYVQTNTSVQEIVLPLNGVLVLSQYMSLTFPSNQNNNNHVSCDGKELMYNGSVSRSWFDPDNWCEVTDIQGSCMSESDPHLDTEYLPCEKDQVVFPSGSGFMVDLESGVDIYVGKLSIRGEDYTTGNFRSYVNHGSGKKEFERNSHQSETNLNIGGDLCRDPAGCPCANDGGMLEQKVCDIRAAMCPQLTCNAPLLPMGHCCHFCGSLMVLDFGPGFKYKGLENIIHNVVPRAQRRSVKIIVSRLHSDQVQVVIQNLDGSIQIQTVVDNIKQKIQPDAMGNSRYRITNIKVTSSDGTGASENVQAQKSGLGKMSSGSIASLVIAIIVVIAIIIMAMFCLIDRKRTSSSNDRSNNVGRRFHLPKFNFPHTFSRFGRHDSNSGMELGPSVVFNDNMTMSPEMQNTVRGFENPTYDANANAKTSSNGETNGAPISTIDISQPTFLTPGGDTGFTNPMYGTKGKIEDLSYLHSGVKMNPMFTTEGVEEDSEI